ncbi:MAG TPA: hypothetical protein VMW19_07120 [Myxococcota bacterium]|nr:hypothetical protein [Myxococcota bacterium]
MAESDAGRRGPPPLRPFGLMLHRDGSWTHDGVPIRNRRLRAAFDRSVRYAQPEGVFVVQLGRFRGQIEVEEAAFFVRLFDPDGGEIALSDGTREPLDPTSLALSAHDGALLCRVKRELVRDGLLARFFHAAQSELLCAVEETSAGPRLRMAGALHPLPPLD